MSIDIEVIHAIVWEAWYEMVGCFRKPAFNIRRPSQTFIGAGRKLPPAGGVKTLYAEQGVSPIRRAYPSEGIKFDCHWESAS